MNDQTAVISLPRTGQLPVIDVAPARRRHVAGRRRSSRLEAFAFGLEWVTKVAGWSVIIAYSVAWCFTLPTV